MADARLFDRRCSVIIASPALSNKLANLVEVTDLRVSFKIEKDLEKAPNKAAIVIYNMSEHTRSLMQAKGAKVALKAGYASGTSLLFIGDVRTLDHVREGADWLTKIEAGDGERAYTEPRVSASFAAGVKVPDVIRKVTSALGLDMAPGSAEQLGNAQYTNGYSVHGRASAELDKILAARGFKWSVQDGRVQIHRPGAPASQLVQTLSSESGLVGSPEFGSSDKPGKAPLLKAKSLLAGGFLPGGLVNLASRRHKGVHVVHKVTHTGDTAGGDWYTELEAEVKK